MKKILVSGLVNIETSLKVDNFPIEYNPIEYPFYGVNSVVSGVGYNIVKALKTLGDNVELMSVIGDDLLGKVILNQLKEDNISTKHILVDGDTAQSVVLVDKNGSRKIYCDLKKLQEIEPLKVEEINPSNYSIAILTNINFNRALLDYCRKNGLLIATDVHVLMDAEDSYNRDFMSASNILFLSNEAIRDREYDAARVLYRKYHNDIIVIGCGEEGALLYVGKNDEFIYEPAIAPKGISSTLGAGDALFSSFIHFYNRGLSPEECLKRAVLFAGLKISVSGGSKGFPSEEELKKYFDEMIK